jgi:PPE-repeat protein
MDVERLADLTWTPDGRWLLVATRLGDGTSGGPVRARLLVIDTGPPGQGASSPPPIELVTLPAEVVPGSYSWGPDGRWVAFLARASAAPGGRNLLSLNALKVATDGTAGFRYLADLGRADSTGSANVPVAPVTWEPATANRSGRLLYPAPIVGPTTGGPGPLNFLALSVGPAEPPPGLFLANPDAPAMASDEPRRLGTATGVLALVWRQTAPGSAGMPLLGFVRSDQDGKPLAGRVIDPASGRLQDIGLRLPADVAPGKTPVAARWDVAHGRALIVSRPSETGQASPTAPGALDVWLVQFAPAIQPVDEGAGA